VRTLIHHKKFAEQFGVVDTLAPMHNHVIQARMEYLLHIKAEALRGVRLRWHTSFGEIKNIEPFGFQNFHHAMSREHDYVPLLLE